MFREPSWINSPVLWPWAYQIIDISSLFPLPIFFPTCHLLPYLPSSQFTTFHHLEVGSWKLEVGGWKLES